MRARRDRPTEAEIRRRVHELLTLVQLDWLAQRYPSQLSGGQRQRIALARELAVEPQVLLLDEPFGALDARVRQELRSWLRRLHDELHVTSVFVTHDQEEALEVADRVVIMNQGVIEQIGTPAEVQDQPASPFVYSFLGHVNVLPAKLHGGRAEIGELRVPAPVDIGDGDQARVYMRPYEIELLRDPEPENTLAATVTQVRPLGPIVRIELTRPELTDPVIVELSRERFEQDVMARGEQRFLKPRQPQVLPAKAGA